METLTPGPRCSAVSAPVRSGFAVIVEEFVEQRCPLEYWQISHFRSNVLHLDAEANRLAVNGNARSIR